MSAKRQATWTLTDHACRGCGGRVLQSASGVATAGGNPVFRCADCGAGSSGMGPDCVCWCGFQHRRDSTGARPYACIRLAAAVADDALRRAVLAHGFDPDRPRCEVGIYSPDHLREILVRLAAEGKR